MLYYTKNAPFLIHKCLHGKGFEKTEDLKSAHVHWSSSRYSIKYMKQFEETKFNHFAVTQNITRKSDISILLKRNRMVYGEVYDFFPDSVIFSEVTRKNIYKFLGDKGPWIGKPSVGSRGNGIYIDSTIEKLENKISEDLNLEPGVVPVVVLQNYINNPFLIKGYKFDLRVYVLVSNFHPLTAHIYNDGLARFCLKKYDYEDFDDHLAHLTNTSIQHKVSKKIDPTILEDFQDAMKSTLGVGNYSKYELYRLMDYLKSEGIDTEKVWKDMVRVILLTLIPLTITQQRTNQCFELLGFDLMFDEDLNVKLIEVNLSPSLGNPTVTDNKVKIPLINGMIDIMNFGKKNPGQSDVYTKIFPFNDTTYDTSYKLSATSNNHEENMQTLINEIRKKY